MDGIKEYPMIFSNVSNETISYSSNDIHKILKENKRFMVFEEISNIKLFEVQSKVLKTYMGNYVNGDAFCNFSGDIIKVKTFSGEK